MHLDANGAAQEASWVGFTRASCLVKEPGDTALGPVQGRTMSRRKRREEAAAEIANRVVVEHTPVPGLDQIAALNGWTAVSPPDLDEGAVGCICRLALATHGVFDPDKKRRDWFRQLFIAVPYSPAYSQYEAVRLVNCYSATVDGRSVIVGNAFFDIQFMVRPSGYGGPMAAPDELGAAFCAAPLATQWPSVQLAPAMRGWLSSKGNGLGYADLDAHFDAFARNKDIARRIITPDMASLVAGREDWGFSLHQSTLVCVTAAPLAAGSEGQQLVESTAHIASLLPANPSALR